MKIARTTRTVGFTLVEIMIVVLIIGILLAIAIPGFINARESSRAKNCVANLAQINSGKTQCAMDNKLAATSTATFLTDGTTLSTPGANGIYQLVGPGFYMKTVPVCQAGGVYKPDVIAQAPWCTVGSTAAATPIPNSDYGFQGSLPGKFYHGLQ